MATSIWASSGSWVVSICMASPGQDKALQKTLLRYFPANLMISYDMALMGSSGRTS